MRVRQPREAIRYHQPFVISYYVTPAAPGAVTQTTSQAVTGPPCSRTQAFMPQTPLRSTRGSVAVAMMARTFIVSFVVWKSMPG